MLVQQVTGPIAFHGEGTVTRHHVGSVAAAARPRRSGGSVRGVEWGLALEEPDGSLAYYNDTPTAQVSVFDYDTETGLTGRRTFVLPAIQTTAWAFGGEHLDRLFITTSQEDVDIAADPLAGPLLVAGMGVRRIATRPFAG